MVPPRTFTKPDEVGEKPNQKPVTYNPSSPVTWNPQMTEEGAAGPSRQRTGSSNWQRDYKSKMMAAQQEARQQQGAWSFASQQQQARPTGVFEGQIQRQQQASIQPYTRPYTFNPNSQVTGNVTPNYVQQANTAVLPPPSRAQQMAYVNRQNQPIQPTGMFEGQIQRQQQLQQQANGNPLGNQGYQAYQNMQQNKADQLAWANAQKSEMNWRRQHPSPSNWQTVPVQTPGVPTNSGYPWWDSGYGGWGYSGYGGYGGYAQSMPSWYLNLFQWKI